MESRRIWTVSLARPSTARSSRSTRSVVLSSSADAGSSKSGKRGNRERQRASPGAGPNRSLHPVATPGAPFASEIHEGPQLLNSVVTWRGRAGHSPARASGGLPTMTVRKWFNLMALLLAVGGITSFLTAGPAPEAQGDRSPPLLSGHSPAQPDPSPRLDAAGDPLPAGALVRLGTVRFRPQQPPR